MRIRPTISSRARHTARALAVACSAALLASCGSANAPDIGVIDALKARQHAAAGFTPYLDLTDLLDNTKFQTGSKAPVALTEAVVRGRITDVTKGQGFTIEGSDAPGGTLTDFDDANAQWRTFHATVKVAEVISGTAPDSITVGLAFGPDIGIESVRTDLTAMPEVVLFLQRSPVFGYDETIYAVVSDGALIAQVDDKGVLTLPVLEANESAPMLERSESLDTLRQAAREPQRVIQLDDTGTERIGDG